MSPTLLSASDISIQQKNETLAKQAKVKQKNPQTKREGRRKVSHVGAISKRNRKGQKACFLISHVECQTETGQKKYGMLPYWYVKEN